MLLHMGALLNQITKVCSGSRAILDMLKTPLDVFYDSRYFDGYSNGHSNKSP